MSTFGGVLAGQTYPGPHYKYRTVKKAATAVVKGTVGMFAATGWEPATGSSVNPMGVFTQARAAADADCQVQVTGIVTVTADDAIKPGNFVMPTTGGKVIAWDGVSNASILGIYLYKPGDGGGSTSTIAADAAQNDVIYVLLQQGGGDATV